MPPSWSIVRSSARRRTCTWREATSTASVGTRGKAPYRSVLTHGFVVDGQGRKMSKSVGNVVAPEDVIKKYGAEVLRLWVAAQDYRDDIRISPEILTRLSEAYRRIRNTCRYILGNLCDFDPGKDCVPVAEMPELDRWALHQLEILKQKVLAAYDACEFHVLYHAVNSFCTVEMSAFYLDILKDRVYTSATLSPERKCAQTAMYRILEAIVKLVAPVLSFTADEVWRYMPKQPEESVHLASFPPLCPENRDDALVERWERIIGVRAEVSKALEQARVQKVIGHSLDAMVTIAAPSELHGFLQGYASELKSVFIVSKVELVDSIEGECYEAEGIPGMSIRVTAAPGVKCERCWCYDEEIGRDPEHPTICPKCLKAVK
jgi:isoleucyl-tRNA synthetase